MNAEDLYKEIIESIKLESYCYIIEATYNSFTSGLYEINSNGSVYKNETVEIFEKFSDQIEELLEGKGIIFISNPAGNNPKIKEIPFYNPELFNSDLFDLLIFQELGIQPVKEENKENLKQSIKKEKIKSTLAYACYTNDSEKIFETLEKAKPSQLNKKIQYTGTPLGFCAENNNVEAFIAIAQAGADIGKKSLSDTPLVIAFQKSPEIVKFIFEHYPEQFEKEVSKKGFSIALRTENTEVLKLILDTGADINCEGKSFPPLHNFADYDNIVGLKFLVECGVDVNVKNENKQTALDRAKNRNSTNAIKFLSTLS